LTHVSLNRFPTGKVTGEVRGGKSSRRCGSAVVIKWSLWRCVSRVPDAFEEGSCDVREEGDWRVMRRHGPLVAIFILASRKQTYFNTCYQYPFEQEQIDVHHDGRSKLALCSGEVAVCHTGMKWTMTQDAWKPRQCFG
jgi:hypothetical protein